MNANIAIARFIKVCSKIDIPGLIMSLPGFGKTTTVELYCKYHDINLTTLIASQYAIDDVLGIQAMNEGQLKRFPPIWYNELMEQSRNGKENLLFIDEITTCDEFIQAPLLNLIFNKKLEGFDLPKNTVIIAAGNFSDSLNNKFQLTPPLANRFMILNLNVKDYSVQDIINIDFDKIKYGSKKELQDFLFDESNIEYADIDSLNVIKSTISDMVKFDKSHVENSSVHGLIGFPSVRSISYALKFAEYYIPAYGADDILFRVVGDTIGYTKNDLLLSIILADRCKAYSNKSGLKSVTVIKDINRQIGRWRSYERSGYMEKKPAKISHNKVEEYIKVVGAHRELITDEILENIKYLKAKKLIDE